MTEKRRLLGFEISLKLNNEIIAYGTSVSIDDNTETIDVSCKDDTDYASKLAGRSSYSLSFEGMNGVFDGEGAINLRKLKKQRKMIEWALVPTSALEKTAAGKTIICQAGKGILTSVGDSYGDQEASTYSCSFEGCGDIDFPEITIPASE
jgi:predicted secreted protein